MNKNLIIILTIFILPVALYFTLKHTTAKVHPEVSCGCSLKAEVIEFSSPMCYECKKLAKVFNPLKAKYKNKVKFRKIMVNTTNKEEEALVKKYNVKVVPTLVFIDKNGKITRKTEGSLPKSRLEGYLKELNNG